MFFTGTLKFTLQAQQKMIDSFDRWVLAQEIEGENHVQRTLATRFSRSMLCSGLRCNLKSGRSFRVASRRCLYRDSLPLLEATGSDGLASSRSSRQECGIWRN